MRKIEREGVRQEEEEREESSLFVFLVSLLVLLFFFIFVFGFGLINRFPGGHHVEKVPTHIRLEHEN